MKKAKPSSKDFEAVDSLLQSRPEAIVGDREELRQLLAELRATRGASRFNVLFGLRKPRSVLENLYLEVDSGAITNEIFRERLHAEVFRDLDLRMLQDYVDGIEKLISGYSQFLQQVNELHRQTEAGRNDGRRDKAQCKKAFRRMQGKVMFKQQLPKILDFFTEARLMHHLGLASAKDFNSPTAGLLVFEVLKYTTKSWISNCRLAERSWTDPSYLYATTAASLFMKVTYPSLPRPQNLLNLLFQDHQAAKLLYEKKHPSTPEKTAHVELPQAQFQVGIVHLQADQVEMLRQATSKKKVRPAPGLTVSSWDQLTLLIDAKYQVFAFTKRIEIGSPIKKAEGTPIELNGDRWKQIFDVFAAAGESKTVGLYSLLAKLGYVNASAVRKDPRARAGAIDGQLAAELGRGEQLIDRLDRVLRDLGRELRRHVQGTKGKGKTPWNIDKDRATVTTELNIGFAVPDESGHLFFAKVSI